jgi:hypothetical protein
MPSLCAFHSDACSVFAQLPIADEDQGLGRPGAGAGRRAARPPRGLTLIHDGWDDDDARLGTDAADLARFLSRADARTMNRERLQADLDMAPEQYVEAWRDLHRFGYVSLAELRRLVVER